MIYFIDFDGTICPNSGSPPQDECREVMKLLKKYNHTIVIYSCRANPDCVEDSVKSVEEMIDYLNHWDIPFDRVEPNKPLFNFYIDDRAVGVPLTKDHSVDWVKIKKLI